MSDTTSLQCPSFAVVTDDDRVISSQTVEKYYQSLAVSNQLLIYSAENTRMSREKVIVRTSCYPEHNILNFAHTSIHIHADNVHYGKNSPYRDVTDTRQTLRYNPDFEYLSHQLKEFLLI